jgi:hypothetical protein
MRKSADMKMQEEGENIGRQNGHGKTPCKNK